MVLGQCGRLGRFAHENVIVGYKIEHASATDRNHSMEESPVQEMILNQECVGGKNVNVIITLF